jgi:hypothetical protein
MPDKPKSHVLARPKKAATAPEIEKFEVKLVYKMVTGKKEFETLKAQLEAEGYTVHSKEHNIEDGEVKRYSAKILAAKWFPISEIKAPAKKPSTKPNKARTNKPKPNKLKARTPKTKK